MSESQQSTALIHAPTGAAINAIVHAATSIAARMLPAYNKTKGRRGKSRNRISLEKRIDAIKAVTVMDPEQLNVPLVVEISFRPFVSRKDNPGCMMVQGQKNDGTFLFHEPGSPVMDEMEDGTLVQRKDEQGKPMFHGAGVPIIETRDDVRIYVQGRIQLPGDRRHHTVQLARITTGHRESGGLVPAIVPDKVNGGWRGGQSIPCFLFWELDKNTLERKPRGHLMAMPLGLVPVELLDRWNHLVQQKIQHGQDGTWFPIPHILNRIGGEERIEFTPKGAHAMQGLTCIFDNPEELEINTSNPAQSGNLQVVGMFGGKLAFLGKRSIPICFKQERVRLPDGDKGEERYGVRMVPAPNVFRVIERFGNIQLDVVGLASEVTTSRGALNHGQQQQLTEALALIGGDLKSTAPRSVARLFMGLSNDPPVQALMRRQIVPENSSHELILATWRGMKDMVVETAKSELKQAHQDIVHALGIGGSQAGNDCPSLSEICGGEVNDQTIRAVFDGNWGDEENIFATWMLCQPVVNDLGFNEWEEGSWVLTNAFRDLFAQRVKAAGKQIPPRSANTTQAPDQPEHENKDKKTHQPKRRRRRTPRTGSSANGT